AGQRRDRARRARAAARLFRGRRRLARARLARLSMRMAENSRPSIRQWLSLAAALLLLNSALTVGNVWPTPWVTLRGELSVEVAAIVLALAAYAELAARRGWPLPGRRAGVLLTVVMFLLTIGRYADVTAPALYGRPVNLYWDAQHLPNIVAMLADV